MEYSGINYAFVDEKADNSAKIQKLGSHITQIIYAGSMFAYYFYLNQVQRKKASDVITHNSVYRIFSLFTR